MTDITSTMTRRNDAETSVTAAERLLPHLSDLQQQVLDVLRKHQQFTGDGMNDNELEKLTEFATCKPSTIRKRRGELVRKGLVQPTGETRGEMQLWRALSDAELEHQQKTTAPGWLF